MPMHGSNYFWPHQRCCVFRQSSKGNLVSQLTDHRNTMRYNQVLSRNNMTLSTRSRLPYSIMEILSMQRVINFTTSWHMHTFLKKVCHQLWISMTLVRNYTMIMLPNKSIEITVCGHQSRSRITPCSCQETRHSQDPWPIGGSKRDERSLWSSDGSSQIKARCGSEECK